MSTKVKVAVRVRPLNKRELDVANEVIVDMTKDQTFLKTPRNEKKAPKSFTFDHCFWSMDKNDPKFASQDFVYSCLGVDVLDNAFNGYNACIFAYGQTGSGKSYTMMGASTSKGLIPKICDSLFERIAELTTEHNSYKVEVSYMEIYNEKVRDLLCPKSDKHNLKVREHAALGPYVDGLSKLLVNSYEDIENLMSEGNKSRTVAATSMNAESSRSHAVFTVVMTQTQYDEMTNSTGEKVSKLSLVDLAGSERVSKTNASGDRLKEGGNINKSLTTLGLVISALADASSGKASSKKKNFIPYRDSVLTWLLKDNLGGNSKTVMVATVSPSGDNYEESLSTLRYADRAKRIENHAVINEDPNAKIIRELRDEVEKLKAQLIGRGLMSEDGHLKEQLVESEKLMHQASLTWEQKEKQTEQIHQERHNILEKMGISVQDTGIAVEKSRYYLVNLNADPSLNEMLVYYLKDHTKVGRPDATSPQDIQLNGLGILSDHCILEISDETAYLCPIDGARSCVNGQVVTERTELRHGDRILWGNNHFFRINCPHHTGSHVSKTEDKKIDFDFAQNELVLNELDSSNEPLQAMIKQLEDQHEKEKQGALDQQKELYEQKLEELRREKTPDSLNSSRISSGYGNSSGYGTEYFPEIDDEQLQYEENLRLLREEVIRANVLVREANQLSSEMKKDTNFTVTLQIPTASLSQAMNKGSLTSEVAIVVKQKVRGTQVWSVDKLSNKIYDMRDVYQTAIENNTLHTGGSTSSDDDSEFFEVECHTLIGVATVWLECLYQDVPLDYSAPIISQQGEVCGQLSVEIKRLQDDRRTNHSSDSSSFSDDDDDNEGLAMGSHVQVQITLKEAQGLPLSLCNYVFGQYTFFDEELVVIPPQNMPSSPGHPVKTNCMIFNSTKVFTIEVDEDFLDYVTDGSLAIEIYGNRSRGFDQRPNLRNTPSQVEQAEKSLIQKWKELSRQIELWVEILELNDQGFYAPVELQQREGGEAGGVFMLRQGFSRRLSIQCVIPKHSHNGALPIHIESITNVAVGSVTTRSSKQKGLDSYQELDLLMMRDRFSNWVTKRKEFLDQQIQEMINKPNKTPVDKEHEGVLIDQWVSLTEERNAILCPPTGSGVPGSPADWNPLPGMEKHIPVIFLDLDDNALNGCPNLNAEPAGHQAFLSFEQSDSIIGLPILKYDNKRVTAITSWDSSIHDSVYLNRITPNTERVYIILKVTIRVSSPALVNVVLRKRICVRMYKRPSIKDSLRKKFWRQTNVPTRCGVTFELISHIPRQSDEKTQECESLAQKAAEAMHSVVVNGDGDEIVNENAIEKYNKGISHVENILNLHKLRQEVLVKEKLAAVGRSSKIIHPRNLRKFASTPNLLNVSMNDLSNLDFSASPLLVGESTRRIARASSRQSACFDQLKHKHLARGLRNDFMPSPNHSPLMNNIHPKIEASTPPQQQQYHNGVLHDNEDQVEQEFLNRILDNDSPPHLGDSPTVSLSSLPRDLVEQANLERERELRKQQLQPTMNLPLQDQGVAGGLSPSSDDDSYAAEENKVAAPQWQVGDTVLLNDNMEGQVRFLGRTKFADGVWVGIALSEAEGKNDGSVNGVSYFNCKPLHGLFIRAEKLAKT